MNTNIVQHVQNLIAGAEKPAPQCPFRHYDIPSDPPPAPPELDIKWGEESADDPSEEEVE